jgi:flagellar assembly protein FliH
MAYNFDDMALQAARYLDQVRAEGDKILAAARQQAEAIKTQAVIDGQAAGMAAVEERLQQQVARQMDSLVPAVQKFVEELDHAKGAWLKHWEDHAIGVAVAIAEKVIRRQIEQTPAIQTELIAAALELASSGAEICIRLNPEDHKALGDSARRLAAEMSRQAPAEVVADASVPPGGCRIQTTRGQIDTSIEAQLKRIEEELK